MGLFDSKYLREYNSLMQKIDDLNEQNVRGYDTFKEYVLSDEIMMSYFRQLKKLDTIIRKNIKYSIIYK